MKRFNTGVVTGGVLLVISSFYLPAQTTVLQKKAEVFRIPKASNSGVSNVVILSGASGKKNAASARAADRRINRDRFNNVIVTYSNNGTGLLVGMRYNPMWRVSPTAYLGFGVGAYYIEYRENTTFYYTSISHQGGIFNLPMVIHVLMGSHFYLEPFGGPEYISSNVTIKDPPYPQVIYHNKTYSANYNNEIIIPDSKFTVMGGCNLGYHFTWGLDLSVRYNTDFGLGFGIGYGKK